MRRMPLGHLAHSRCRRCSPHSDNASIAKEVTGGIVTGAIGIHAPGGLGVDKMIVSTVISVGAAAAGLAAREAVSPGSLHDGDVNESVVGAYASVASGALLRGGSSVGALGAVSAVTEVFSSTISDAFSSSVGSSSPNTSSGGYDVGPLDGGTCHE